MGSMREFMHQPSTCARPVCKPGVLGAECTKTVCAPVESDALLHINSVTTALYTIDYVVRICTAHALPAAVLFSRQVAIDISGRVIDRVRPQ
jgi:hypothetical protein